MRRILSALFVVFTACASPQAPKPPEELWPALRQMLESPVLTLVPPWSWKAAASNAIRRSVMFFVTNLQSGRWEATKAMLVEALLAVFVGGLIGAISQQLRRARPVGHRLLG